jgi:AcrR family transcriptional regulator
MAGRKKSYSFEETTDNSLDARQRLLETGARLFAEQGFEAISTRQLAKEADVNIAMIAYYFGSKEELLKAIFAEKFPQMRSHLEQVQNQDISPWEKICLVIDLYIDRILSQSAMTKLIFREMSFSHRPQVKEFLLAGLERNWSILYQLINEGKEQGIFRESVNPRMVFFTFFSTIAQMVNSRSMAMHFLGIKNWDEVHTLEFQQMVKSYFKELFGAYLIQST